jgi:hypothetical protein
MIHAVAMIILYALASAIFPALLAGVAVILSREKPAKLLVAFWLGGFTVSVIAGMTIISAFGEKAASLGSEGKNLNPGYSVAIGVAALALGALLGTHGGRALIDGWRERRALKKPKKEKCKPWEERMLDKGSIGIADIAGGVLNLPGPFYLLALGDIATHQYGFSGNLGLIVFFKLIMLLLVELPLIGFIFSPEKTDEWVSDFAGWLNRNGIKIVAGLAAVWGVVLIAKGVADLLA